MTQCELIEILGQPNALSRKNVTVLLRRARLLRLRRKEKRCQDKVFVSVVSGIADRGGSDRHKQDSASPPFSPMKHSDESHSEREGRKEARHVVVPPSLRRRME